MIYHLLSEDIKFKKSRRVMEYLVIFALILVLLKDDDDYANKK